MPLVRYLIGDLVLLKEPFLSQCSCGAEGGVQIEKLMGRTKDSFLNGNNELVTMKDIDELVADVPEILNYKIDLRDTESTFFKYTTFDDSDVSEKALNMLAQRLRELFSSSFSFQFQWESSLSPEQSGKFSLLARGQR
jgi:phenylacetate-coenzyme A ligase PaaK-like adenylate-forming protein